MCLLADLVSTLDSEMPFDWSEYLDLADWLARNAGTDGLQVSAEAAQRSAASRAYYSAFQSSMALLVRRREYRPVGDGSDHGAVARAYQSHVAVARRQIGTWLDRLRDRRRRADYDSEMVNASAMATASVSDARNVLTYLQSQ